MTRLTDLQEAQFNKSRMPSGAELDIALATAKRLQAQAVRQQGAKLFAALDRGLGLPGLRKVLAARQTRAQLERLDDRLLTDIGLCRGDIARAVTGAPAQPSLATRMARKIQTAIQRHQTRRTLAALPDHLLADIGIERYRIAEATSEVLTQQAVAAKNGGSSLDGLFDQVESLLHPWQRRTAAKSQARRAKVVVAPASAAMLAANANKVQSRVA